MGWLGKFIDRIAGEEPRRLTYARSIRLKDGYAIPGVGEPVAPDACYIELYLESLRLARARRFGTTFNAVAYSFIGIVREGDLGAQIGSVSKPSRLIELDDSSLDKVITVSKQIVGPTAFRGNPISLELGLFSVKSGNVVAGVLDYVARVSSTAGMSYVGSVKPFLPLITQGMDLLAAQTRETVLEVGLDTDASIERGTVLAVVDQTGDDIDEAALVLREDGTLEHGGRELDAGYAVFSIRARADKPDYGEIPELKHAFDGVVSAIRTGRRRDVRDALAAFRRAVVTSPDLIPTDADRLIRKADDMVERALPSGGEASVTFLRGSGGVAAAMTLADLGLYD